MRKLEEMDLFLCASSILFCNAMIEASPFSSLEHAISFARNLWFNTLPIQSWLDTFSAHRHLSDAITFARGDIRMGLLQYLSEYRKKFGFGFVTSTNLRLSQQILEEVQARYQNSLQVELETASREEFTLIERRLTKLWERLSREKILEVSEETGEVVQDSMLEDDVAPDSSDEVVSKGHQPSIVTFDLNKTPEENDIC
ncbi:uric acid degradation bifunctional protein TTL-like isoform X1 [Arachis ipaensis]|uniref:uric acid degradation bifunctional protein TTL-like isoform X1 n=2 Tax=Arachis ipaensis TaxID=130454 RepID=UPI000A2B4F96|nr:uric acid degradation bifunctional protein TTL-like isoform X1 [Arachis ipaensis]